MLAGTLSLRAVGLATVLSRKCDILSLLKDDQIVRDNRLPVLGKDLAPYKPSHNHNHNFPKGLASDVASKQHLTTYQMRNLCVFSVFPCVEVRTSSTTTRDRNLQFRGAVCTGGSPLDFWFFHQYLCAHKLWRK